MISRLSSPTVCVIDDDEHDYRPILSALNGLYVSSIHLPGTFDSLPNQPFDRLRLVFLDLHLSGSIGKDAASYTANVFRRVVSVDTAPVIVVIWSKYAHDKANMIDIPPQDQETEEELFKRVIAHPQRGTVNLLKKRQKRPKRHRSTLLTLVCSALSITSARGRERHLKPTAQV